MTTPTRTWHFLTGEYPPDRGGVADYTALVAAGLAKHGCAVHVWSTGDSPEAIVEPSGVVVHRVAGRFGWTGLARLNRALNTCPEPRILCVQYVPHAFGWKAMNVAFIAWVVGRRVLAGDEIVVMFHEVIFPWVRRPLHHNVIAFVTRIMAGVLARSAHRLFVSIPAWAPLVRTFGCLRRAEITTVPIPATIPYSPQPDRVVALRGQLLTAGTRFVVGHFGTYGSLITQMLGPVVRALLQRRADVAVVLLGSNGGQWKHELIRDQPAWSNRIVATGELTAAQVATHLQACDLVIQPYPDGASARRTSLMAALANGVPVVTTTGALSDAVWYSGVVPAVAVEKIAEFPDVVCQLLDDPHARTRVGQAGAKLYQDQFTLERTISILMHDVLERRQPERAS